jgi:hypothetical protein
MADKQERNRKDFSQTMHAVVAQVAERSEREEQPIVLPPRMFRRVTRQSRATGMTEPRTAD